MTRENEKDAVNDVIAAVFRQVQSIIYEDELPVLKLVRAYGMLWLLVERLGLPQSLTPKEESYE